MQQLELVSFAKLAWRDVPAPTLRAPTEALVRPLAVARCDLDAAVLRGDAPFRGKALHWLRDHLPERVGQRGVFQNAPFRGPYAFGHEMVGEVVEVGESVRVARCGDLVVVPFQITCGVCRRCARGLTGSCEGVPARSMYGFGELGGTGWGGALADLVRVPFADRMLVPLPNGVDPAAAASAPDNVADGYRTVAGPLQREPGAPVLVVGGGAASIGLYAVQCALALGAGEVRYADRDRAQLASAERLGAKVEEIDPARARPKRLVPITVDASADPAGLAYVLRSTDAGGICTSVGIYYSKTTPIPLLEMYGRGVTLTTGRADSRALLPAVLELMAAGRLRPEQVTTTHAAFADAHEAFFAPGAKVVVSRPALSPVAPQLTV